MVEQAVIARRRRAASEEERVYTASQTQLIWWRFRKHRLAIVGTVVLVILYTLAVFCEFFSPYLVGFRHDGFEYAPPQMIHVIGPQGGPRAPFVYGLTRERHPVTFSSWTATSWSTAVTGGCLAPLGRTSGRG